MITKADLKTLSETRLADAGLLFSAGRYSAAYYLAGYTVELGLKACVAGVFQSNVIPDKSFVSAVYTHKLDELLALSGLKLTLKSDMGSSTELSAAWGVASKWNEASRYVMWDQFAAASMVDAVGNPTYGVLQWLKKYW